MEEYSVAVGGKGGDGGTDTANDIPSSTVSFNQTVWPRRTEETANKVHNLILLYLL